MNAEIKHRSMGAVALDGASLRQTIYAASDPALSKVPDFYCDDETALADMAKLAGVEGGA